MKLSTIINHCSELARIIIKSVQPSDNIASEYFRSKKYIGSNERKIISEIVFTYLRIISLSDYFCNMYYKQLNVDNTVNPFKIYISTAIALNFKPEPMITLDNYLSKLNKDFSSTDDEMKSASLDLISNDFNYSLFKEKITEFVDYYNHSIFSADEIPVELYCMQEHLINLLKKKYSHTQIKQIAHSLVFSAPVCLRVNTNLISIEDAEFQLEKSGILCEYSPLSPQGLVLKSRSKLNDLDLFKSGLIEVQDIGSQLISYSLNPTTNSKILDACAGAGGKTLHLAVLTNNTSKIIATDIEFNRLKEISGRAAKSGISSIKVIHQKKSATLHTLTNEKFDYILIDAPCSGMGTVRRMPMPKWRLSEKLIAKLQKNQLEILTYYSQFLKPGGELVYATCSLLPDENEEVVNAFLSTNDSFETVALKDSFDCFGIAPNLLDSDDYMLYLSPAFHATDGFFMAKLRRLED